MTPPGGAPWAEGLATVCHELRRPLTVIRGAATLLLEADERLAPDSRAQMLALIDSSARSMADLVDDLALLAHLEAAQVQARIQAVPVAALLAAAAEAVRTRDPGARVFVVRPEEISVETDPEQVLNLLRALVSALRRSPQAADVELSAVAAGDGVRILVASHSPRGEDGPDGLALLLARGLSRLLSAELAETALPGGRSAFSFNLNRRV